MLSSILGKPTCIDSVAGDDTVFPLPWTRRLPGRLPGGFLRNIMEGVTRFCREQNKTRPVLFCDSVRTTESHGGKTPLGALEGQVNGRAA